MTERGDLAAFAEAVEAFCEERDWTRFHTPKDLAIGLVTEAAELLEHFRFLDEAESMAALDEPEFRRRVGHELGDALFFLVRFAQRFDFELVAEGFAKLDKSDAKYPAEAYRGKNRKVFDR